jgi:hypothetical protein
MSWLVYLGIVLAAIAVAIVLLVLVARWVDRQPPRFGPGEQVWYPAHHGLVTPGRCELGIVVSTRSDGLVLVARSAGDEVVVRSYRADHLARVSKLPDSA